MTDTTADAPPKKKGGLLKTLLIVLVVGLLFGGGGFAGGIFYAGQQEPASGDILQLIESEGGVGADGAKRVPRALPDRSAFETRYHEFAEPLTTNLRGSRRFLQIGVGISTQYDDTVISHIETHELALKSDMLAVMSGFTEDDVTGQNGRDALAEALRDAMNIRLEALEGFGGVEGVYFPSFVMQ
ncbi:MAG: flagellar basal body-associated FliL family protein [Pseudomonadota bacterium]